METEGILSSDDEEDMDAIADQKAIEAIKLRATRSLADRIKLLEGENERLRKENVRLQKLNQAGRILAEQLGRSLDPTAPQPAAQ